METKCTLHFRAKGRPLSAECSSLKEALERARGIGSNDIICIKGPGNKKMDQAAIAEWCRKNPPPGMAAPSPKNS
jgi:hypothetical protein